MEIRLADCGRYVESYTWFILVLLMKEVGNDEVETFEPPWSKHRDHSSIYRMRKLCLSIHNLHILRFRAFPSWDSRSNGNCGKVVSQGRWGLRGTFATKRGQWIFRGRKSEFPVWGPPDYWPRLMLLATRRWVSSWVGDHQRILTAVCYFFFVILFFSISGVKRKSMEALEDICKVVIYLV